MSNVFVLDREQRPLDPVHPAYARWLLSHHKAAVFRRFPFTLILKERKADGPAQPVRLKIDPGSKSTGLALVNDASGEVVWAAELTHRGQQVRKHLTKRRAVRRSRRQRKTRYRPARWQNRRRKPGWLPPSLESRISNIVTWVARLRRLCPIGALSQELVKFDTQLLEHPEITGVEYQQGTLAGYELREYLLEKWGRRCAYCQKTGVPLQIEHLTPRARGGSNRVSNLALACEPCNLKKGTQTAAEFGYPDLQTQAKQPLRDAAVVNATRWALYERLKATGLPVETGTGGRTKWNRTQRNLPKTHWLDAACVGASTPAVVQVQGVRFLSITATGWQCRQMCLMNDPGFPRTRAKQQGRVRGFKTGDMVRAVVPRGTKAGTYVGRVAVRATGSFNITTKARTIQGIPARFCQVIHHQDGYSYSKGGATSSPSPEGEGEEVAYCSMKFFLRRFWLLAALAPLLLAACGNTSDRSPNLTQVSLALDYTPNTNHTGIYVAQQKGWYQQQGLNLSILPYSANAAPETLVATGKADFAISYEESVTLARVSGQDLVSIAAIIQHNTSGLAVRTDSGITSPAGLAGKIYGSFGDPFEPYVISDVINCAGGKTTPAEIKNTSPVLSDDGLASLKTKKVDYVWIYYGWEGIEFKLNGLNFNYFPISSYCIPDYYTPVIITSGSFIHNHPDLVRKFMAATTQGYNYAIAHPDDAANILVNAVAPGTFDDTNLVKQSQEYLSKQYALDAPKWGYQTLEKWHDFPHFLFQTGTLADANGNPVTKEPDESQFFTNEFLP